MWHTIFDGTSKWTNLSDIINNNFLFHAWSCWLQVDENQIFSPSIIDILLSSERFLSKIRFISSEVDMHPRVVYQVLFLNTMQRLISGERVIQWKHHGTETMIFWTLRLILFQFRRINFTAVIVDSKIYVLGGEGLKGAIIQTVEAYDPIGDRWKEVGSLPKPRRYHSTCLIDGKLWSCGGASSALEAQSIDELMFEKRILFPKSDSFVCLFCF